MNQRRTTIEDLELELRRLNIATENVRKAIGVLKKTSNEPTSRLPTVTPTSPSPETPSVVTDRYGTPINIGSQVRFLTKGRHDSTEGVVTRFSRENERVFAIDSKDLDIPQAPQTVRVIDDGNSGRIHRSCYAADR